MKSLLNKTDLLLIDSLKKIDGSLYNTFLEVIQRYSSQYIGEESEGSLHSCELVAAKLGDQYDLDRRQLVFHQSVPHDYFGVIAKETSQGRTLVALGESWVVAGVAKYIREKATYEMSRPVRLREKMATLQASGWTEVSELFGQEFDLSQLTIYRFENLFMIFAPVELVEAKKIMVYLNRNIQMYGSTAYLVIKDLPLETALDLKHLYPLEIEFAGNYLILSSDQLTQTQLERIYHFGEVVFDFPRLDDLRGAYAAYLLSEALCYDFSIRWQDRKLYVGMAGYIQAVDISQQFGEILVEVNREVESFEPLPDYKSAFDYCQGSNVKAFYYLGQYYAAIGPKTESGFAETDANRLSIGIDQIEEMDPLRAAVHPTLSEVTKRYLRGLGYIVEPNPEPIQFNIRLGYRTYEIAGEPSTVYYYKSSYSQELEVYEEKGYFRETIKSELERLLNQGYFFTQRIKNIMRGYPGFVPSESPIQRFVADWTDQLPLIQKTPRTEPVSTSDLE